MDKSKGKTGVTADRDKIEFRLFILKIELELNNLNSILSQSAVTVVFPSNSNVLSPTGTAIRA